MIPIHYFALFIKFLEIIFISSIKFIFAAPVSFFDGFSYFQTIIFTAVGGIGGVFFFYHLSGWIFKKVKDIQITRFKDFKLISKTGSPFAYKVNVFKKIFLRVVRVKLGLLGLIVLTPIIFSIPLGSIIAKRYYSHKKSIPFYLSLSVISWSFILATLLKLIRY